MRHVFRKKQASLLQKKYLKKHTQRLRRDLLALVLENGLAHVEVEVLTPCGLGSSAIAGWPGSPTPAG